MSIPVLGESSQASDGGMDWRSLWLVFEKLGAEWFLVGVVHGSWTI